MWRDNLGAMQDWHDTQLHFKVSVCNSVGKLVKESHLQLYRSTSQTYPGMEGGIINHRIYSISLILGKK